MKPLTEIEKSYWEKYLNTLPEILRPKNPNVTANFAGNREITDELLHLYLIGKKSAGSSIVEDFQTANDPLPQVGNYWIFLNSKDQPSCILKTERIVFNKFRDVPEEIAIAEGEGDLSIEYWKATHKELYLPYLADWGIPHMDEATVITEFFKLVYQ